MKDTIIKGSGNSRTLKSVPNAPTLYPSYDAFIQALATSGLPIDLLGLNAAGINQAGTDLNKANLLTDATEQAIWGSAANRTLDAALKQLRNLITAADNKIGGKSDFEYGSVNAISGEATTITFSFSPQFVIAYFAGNLSYYISVRPAFRAIELRANDYQTGYREITWGEKSITYPNFGRNDKLYYIAFG